MSIKDLVPRFRHGRDPLPMRRDEADPFRDFQHEMNRLFDNFFGEAPLAVRGDEPEWAKVGFIPRVDVSETDKEVKVSAELPGMDDKDIAVELQDDILTIWGEKKSEAEQKGKNWFRREQSYGSFHRSIRLPAGVDSSKATAQFKKGVLSVVAPKREQDKSNSKTIPIQAE